MKRREFITLVGGAAVAWPLAARAQQAAQRPKIGILYPGLASALPSRIAALREALQVIGYREPDNVEFVVRSTGGDPIRIIPVAMELVERKVDVILAASLPAVNAARSATTTTPIVALDLESDPVTIGLIDSLSRPGGQVTGIFFDFPDFSKKWLELLREAIPKLTSIAVLWDPATGPVQIKSVENAAKELKVKAEILEVPGISNLDDSIFTASGKGVDAILMLSSAVIGQSGVHRRTYAGTSTTGRDALSRFCETRRADGIWRESGKHFSSERAYRC
jgi:putative tryptophan/tyrosine transport system substrate-binding protein